MNNTESAFRVRRTCSEALLGDPYVSTTEEVTVSAVRTFAPYSVDLVRYGALRVRLINREDDTRADLEIGLDCEAGRDAIAQAVVSYVAGLGGFYDCAAAPWCEAVLDRVAGALEGARAEFARSADEAAAREAAKVEG